MTFISLQFICFLAATWVIFRFTPPARRMFVLLIASYIFYAAWSVPFLLLIQVTTSVDFLCGRIISRSTNSLRRKSLLWLGISINLLVLCSFKYLNFLTDCQHSLLRYFGLHTPDQHVNWILPLGISFYTFEAISYLIDVYRGNKPAPNWFAYNFYIMFFPHLVAGPIVRFNRFYPQYENGIENANAERVRSAFELLLLGFVFKLIFADGAGIAFHQVAATATNTPNYFAFLSTGAFMAQLYFDFQGYTHIARGASLLFNIDLPVNFRNPGNARNIAEFWQRWNITLSRWLYDYLYVPLGGNRKSLAKRMSAGFATMVVAGIWHGAGWNFVALGVYFGLLVAMYHAYRTFARRIPLLEKLRRGNLFYRIASIALTQCSLFPAAVLFSGRIEADGAVIHNLLSIGRVWQDAFALLLKSDSAPIFAVTALLLASGYAQPLIRNVYCRSYKPMPLWLRAQAVTVVVGLCVILEAGQSDPSFIYAQF